MKLVEWMRIAIIVKPFRVVLFGVLLWAVPFITAQFLIPLKQARSPLFDTLMALTLTIGVAAFGSLHFRRIREGFVREAANAGITWMVMAIAINLPMAVQSPASGSVWESLLDMILSYLIYPVVTLGMGLCLKYRPAATAVK